LFACNFENPKIPDLVLGNLKNGPKECKKYISTPRNTREPHEIHETPRNTLKFHWIPLKIMDILCIMIFNGIQWNFRVFRGILVGFSWGSRVFRVKYVENIKNVGKDLFGLK
jgi:hypothetical protein